VYFLLILSLKSILSSVIGSSFYNWFKDSNVGIWFQLKVDRFMDHFAEKHDLELARTESKFRKDYPLIAERLDYLESIAHPKCGLDGFDDYQPLIDRIEALEKRRKKQK
jgi:hypothetical protein|tara:strand:- start:180 stop:506 length:327 start_codon:yes stop_codon:yes gene_type:complete